MWRICRNIKNTIKDEKCAKDEMCDATEAAHSCILHGS